MNLSIFLPIRLLIFFGLALALSASAIAADVCRTYSFEGMGQHVERIKGFIGKDTTDLAKIEIYITRIDGKRYIQSNFRSMDSSTLGQHHKYPTKLRTNEIDTLREALRNIIFDSLNGVSKEAESQAIQTALDSVTVLIDRSTVDQNGRPEIDLGGARKLRIVTGSSTLATGKVELLPLKKPPPSLVEVLRGCCLKGRPPGRGQEIMQMLASKTLSADGAVLISLVADTATDRVINQSHELSAARKRAGFSRSATWDKNIDAAMSAAKGKTLLLLAHIEGESAAVLNHRGEATYKVGLKELREKAAASGTELFVLGCDTVQSIENNSMALGVVGTHNSRTLASKVAEVLPRSKNLADLAEGLAGPDLTLVAYDKAGGNGYIGASAFAKAKDEGFFVRVFRLLSVQ